MAKLVKWVKLSQKQFRFFERKVHYWAKYYQLGDWEFTVNLGNLKRKAVVAECTCYREYRLVIVICGKQWPSYQATKDELRRTAQHEVLHVLLDPLIRLTHGKSKDIAEAGHSVVSRIVNAGD